MRISNLHPLLRRQTRSQRIFQLDWVKGTGDKTHETRDEQFFQEAIVSVPKESDDSRWQNLKRTDELARLESVLFLAREPLSSRKLAQYAEIADAGRVRRLLKELGQAYSKQPCAFQIVEVAGGFQLRTRSQFAPWLVRLQEVPIEVRLSTTAMETLAIIALKQPVLRASVESVRGTQCGEMIRQLMEKNLVKIVGRSDDLGRPFLYGTTKYFLQVFGLRSLNELKSEPQRGA
ncbi:MAG: SMC-Scp complex subunit ScpB [Planctomycetaceae bacterium]|nr:SMC-Scp complex subunit ScpB [Planctomycetaceae bacterium]